MRRFIVNASFRPSMVFMGVSIAVFSASISAQGLSSSNPEASEQRPAKDSGASPKIAADARDMLTGVWRVKGERYAGEKEYRDVPYVQYKFLADGRFLWASYDRGTGEVLRTAGGTYVVKGDKYVERIEYANAEDLRGMIGVYLEFTLTVKDGKWRHTGKVPNGAVVDELWERAK